MPYEGEFAAYKPLQRIAETERVRNLLRKSLVYTPPSNGRGVLTPIKAEHPTSPQPEYIVAIDGSWAEVDVKNGYPGAKVGYCTVASVLLDLLRMNELDEARPADPREFRKTEEASTLDAAMPGCNVITRNHTSAKDSFREVLYENFHDVILDTEDGRSLLDTYESLLDARVDPEITCPYSGQWECDCKVGVTPGIAICGCSRRLPIYSTDALRIHERFHDTSTNGEAFGEVMQVWERVLLLHLLRWFERRNLLGRVSRIAFLLDGPLAMFGHPAWMSPLIKAELKRINRLVRAETGEDLIIIGIEKSGAFVSHFEELDRTEAGDALFPPQSYFLLSDEYIRERIVFTSGDKAWGKDTYFGRKVLYKSRSGARIVFTMPIVTDAQDDLDRADPADFPALGRSCALLDSVVSSRFPNSVGPIIAAHSHAAIPLTLGSKVLQQLARVLMRNSR